MPTHRKSRSVLCLVLVLVLTQPKAHQILTSVQHCRTMRHGSGLFFAHPTSGIRCECESLEYKRPHLITFQGSVSSGPAPEAGLAYFQQPGVTYPPSLTLTITAGGPPHPPLTAGTSVVACQCCTPHACWHHQGQALGSVLVAAMNRVGAQSRRKTTALYAAHIRKPRARWPSRGSW
jgi:hypothetical protein